MKDTRYAVVLVYTDTDGFLPLVQLADKDSLFPTKKEAVTEAKKLADGLLDAYNTTNWRRSPSGSAMRG